jgi:hypothetical protein
MWLVLACGLVACVTGMKLVLGALTGGDEPAGGDVPAARVVRDGDRRARREPLEIAARVIGGAFLIAVGITAVLIVLGHPG